MKKLFWVLCLFLVIFSYGFVELSFPLETPRILYDLVHVHRSLTTIIYIAIIGGFFWFYGWVLGQARRKKITVKQVWRMIGIMMLVLFFAWPAFSHDIFNYMATAKVSFFYRENPYLVMPIEFSSDPMLNFMHAANKFALYGPSWILLTFIPYFLGINNLILTVFVFKAFVSLFYLGLSWLIWRLSKKNLYSLLFFAFNPLVVIETLVSGHNDVVMMFFALLGFWLVWQKKWLRGLIALFLSIGIKFATLVLAPLFLLAQRVKKEKLIFWAAIMMFLVFLASPLREEIYSWYFIWVITFVALVPRKKFFKWLVWSFSFSLLMRYTPFLYFRNWGGLTPMLKTVITFAPPGVVLVFKCLKKRSF